MKYIKLFENRKTKRNNRWGRQTSNVSKFTTPIKGAVRPTRVKVSLNEQSFINLCNNGFIRVLDGFNLRPSGNTDITVSQEDFDSLSDGKSVVFRINAREYIVKISDDIDYGTIFKITGQSKIYKL